ncbi:MAG: UDP-N-acetylmuramoyl-tripeptide--D-alanyl-D-alanine ligase [Acetatifactor sp.]
MMDLTIQEVADVLGGKFLRKDGEDCSRKISCAVIDSRQMEVNGLFFAVPGERTDGHRFVTAVFQSGAALAVVEKDAERVSLETGTDTSHWGSVILVESTLQALKCLAEYYRRKAGIPIVGITGSVGKTSTKECIATVLGEAFRVLKTEGNFNNEIGVPLTLLRIRPEHQLAVVEMGISDFGEMHRLSRMVRPNVCVITNIGQCHLENLHTRDGILQAKSEIFDYMAEDGEIVLNGDDDKLCTLLTVKGRTPHFFGIEPGDKKEVFVTDIVSRGLFGSKATLTLNGESLPLFMPLPGRHMVLNAAAAACVGRLFDMTGEKIVTAIGKMQPVAGRNNLVALSKYTLIDDCYNANPASMRAAIDLLQMADTKKVAILGDMFELGETSDALHAGVGRYAVEAGVDVLLCVGANSEHMYEGAIAAVSGPCVVAHFPDRESLLQSLKEDREHYIPNGSTVLVKASHGMEFPKVCELLKELSQA